jgi:hypothetical protein
MKMLLYPALLGATLLGNVFVFGQGRRLDSLHFTLPDWGFGETKPGYLDPPRVFKLAPELSDMGKLPRIELLTHPDRSIRIMAPDRMPRMIVDLSRMEPMPTRRQLSTDRMPNKITAKP